MEDREPRLVVAQAQWGSGSSTQRIGTSKKVPKRALGLYEEALALVRKKYVRDISTRARLEIAFRKLSLALLPQCFEGVPPMEECAQPAEECFLNGLVAVSRKCDLEVEQVIAMALKIWLRDLDARCALMGKQMLEELKVSTSGKFGGIGIVVASRAGDYVVVSSIQGSPGQKAGVQAGDVVLAIDGQSIRGLPLIEVLTKVRGPVESKISLSIKERGSGITRRVDLRRRLIRIPPIRYTVLDGGIGYLRIVNFQRTTALQAKKALQIMFGSVPGGLSGLILDLRDNPGGLFDQAIKVADLLVESAPITKLRGRDKKVNQDFSAGRKGTFPQVPMVVLINRGSASAAEVLAGALQGRPGVLVVGERSFGKASVQGIYPLKNGMALRLTTAHYLTADGRDIDGKGIKPDVVVKGLDESRSETGAGRFRHKEDLQADRGIAMAIEKLANLRPQRLSPFTTLY
ncbi:S41 family peptidase [Thermodesulfobacteriota bacterium]